jgi:ribosomal-protein-alanine N-acetyltransferase
MNPIPILETERLILRPFVLEDAGEVRQLAGDRLIADTTLNIPHPYKEGMAREWISRHQPAFDDGKGVTFAVTRKQDGMLIGAISLMGMVTGHQAELGYWIGTSHWNQGFCTEAGEALLGYAFSALGLARVHSCHISRNPASGRVMRKLGMRHEGLLRQHVRKWDKFENLEVYGILRGEWKDAANRSEHRPPDPARIPPE